jgi:hypothetical protein
MSWAIPRTATVSERLHRLRVAGESLARLGSGWLSSADVDIVGSYNTSNVGDRAFAVCLNSAAKSLGLSTHIQDYTRYELSRHARRLVIGGGGVIGPHNTGFLRCAQHRRTFDSSVSVVGVSGAMTAEDVSEPARALLRGARFISVRDRKTQNLFQEFLGRPVELQPDIAFSLLDWYPSLTPNAADIDSNTVGLSITPVLAHKDGRDYVPNLAPSPWFAQRLPEVSAVYSQVAPAYVRLIRSCVERLLRAGRRVVVVPFAAEDDTFARAVLAGTGARFQRFDPDPLSVFSSVARCGRFVATRFHAHVFALLARVPLLPVAYSEKCSLLVSDLTARNLEMGPTHWVHEPERCVRDLSSDESPFVLDDATWRRVRAQATEATLQGVRAISG